MTIMSLGMTGMSHCYFIFNEVNINVVGGPKWAIKIQEMANIKMRHVCKVVGTVSAYSDPVISVRVLCLFHNNTSGSS